MGLSVSIWIFEGAKPAIEMESHKNLPKGGKNYRKMKDSNTYLVSKDLIMELG